MMWSLQQDQDRDSLLCEFCQRLYTDDQYLTHWQNCFDRRNTSFRRRDRFGQSKKSATSTNCDTAKTTLIDEEPGHQKTSKQQQPSWVKPPSNESYKSESQIDATTQPKLTRKVSSSSESSQQIVQKNSELEREQDGEDGELCPNCHTQVKLSEIGTHELRCYRDVECDKCFHFYPMHIIGTHLDQCPELMRKQAEVSSLANQRAVIGGSSPIKIKEENNDMDNLSGLMGMMTIIQSSEVEQSPLFIALQAAFIQFFQKREKGLTEADLNELMEMMRYKQPIPQGDNCVICLDSLGNQQPVTKLPCNHLHHEDCIKKWLKKETNCPLCKGEVKPKEEQQQQEQKHAKQQKERTEQRQAEVQKQRESKKQKEGNQKPEKAEIVCVAQKQKEGEEQRGRQETIYASYKAQQTDADTQDG